MKTLTFLEDENKVVIDGKTFVCVEDEPKVKFEVKKWYFNTKYNTTYRVTAIRDNVIYYVSYKHGEANQKSFILGSEWASTSHLATKEEIESHLRKICDEKYMGKKMRHLDKEDWIFKYTSILWYDEDKDSLHMTASEGEWHDKCSDPIIYKQGKFAEILPDKKKLPKTKKGIHDLINDYDEWLHKTPRQYTPIEEFLDQYED